MRISLAVLALSLSCVPSRPEVKASLQVDGVRIDPRDRAVVRRILQAAKIDEHEVDVRRVSTPYPLTALEPIDAPMAIWVARGRIVGLYLLGVDRSQRCIFETFCKLTGWLRGRSGPRFPGLGLIAGLSELRTLHIHAFSMHRLDGIERLGRLRQLVVQGCELRSLAGLQQLRALRLLDVSSNELEAVDEVSGLTELGVLRLESNRLRRLPNLARLTRVHELVLHDNPSLDRVDFRGLSRAGVLAWTTELTLNRTGLRSLDGISAFGQLMTLNLIGNRLRRLDGIEGLRSLQKLDVSDNQLESLEAASGLPLLTSLSADWNGLTRVDAGRGFPALEDLSLLKNRIARFSDLSLPKGLQRVVLSQNPLGSVDGLEELFMPLKKLESIDLWGTPLVKSDAAGLAALKAKHQGRVFLRTE